MPSSTILVCAPADALRGAIEDALRVGGHRVIHAASAAGAVAQVRDGSIDIVVADGLAVSASVHALRQASDNGITPVIVVAPDDMEARIAYLEAGADDVVGAGFDQHELNARVEALLIRYGRRLASGIGSGLARAELIAFFSPKGGVGTTTLAVNTAVALRAAGSVLIIDLDLHFGQVATHLNLAPRFDLVGLATDEPALADPSIGDTYLTEHTSGISVLAAPPGPEDEARVGPEQVERIIGLFRPRFDRIVVDCGSHLNRRVLPLLELADVHVFVIFPEIAALKAMSALISFVKERSSFRAQTFFVVNHIFPKELLKVRDVEALVGAKPAADVPYTEVDVIRSVNEGVPVVISRPQSPAAASVQRLAKVLAGVQAEAEAPQRRRRLFGR